MKIILATTSPYRKEAFKFLKIPFTSEGSDVDERAVKKSNPEDLVSELAKMKAEAVAKKHADAIVLGFDSLGYFEGRILEKPKTRDEAFDQLKMMSGNMHELINCTYAINTKTKKTRSHITKTKVYFRELSDNDIDKYLDEGDDYKTLAAAYNALGNYSATFVRRVEGSHNLFHGLPLEIIPELLKEIGYN